MRARSVILNAIAVVVLLTFVPNAHGGTLSCLRNGTTPAATDTDGDGIPDASDRVPDDATSACLDVDNDGLNDLREHWFGSNYRLADSDADGLQDGREVTAGLSPTNAADAWIDTDLDGFLNAHEAWVGTDPHDAKSTPSMPPVFETGRFLPFATDQQPAFLEAWDGMTDLAEDGSAVVYFQKGWGDGLGRATGTWTNSGVVIEIAFDPNQVLANWLAESNCSQNPAGQVAQVVYLIRRIAMRSMTESGRRSWIVADELQIETPECGLSETRFQPIAEYIVSRPDELPQLNLSEGTWATWCVNTGRMEKVGAGTFYACRIEVYADGSGQNIDEGVPVSIDRSTDSAQVVRYDDGSAARYYLIRDFGDVQLVAILHENADGTTNFMTQLMIRRTQFTWPGEVVSRYQWENWGPNIRPFGLEMRADGGVNQLFHDAMAGDWQVSDYRAGWVLEQGRLVVRRYMSNTGRIVDPASCDTVPCVLFSKRTFVPEAQSGSRLIVTHIFDFYDPVDTNGDGLFDTATLSSVEQTLRSYHRVPPDLDLDDIVDSIDTDDDGDDLPDVWELDYFNGDNQTGSLGFYGQTGALDPDGDGYANHEEYANGTDPLMPDPAPPRFADVPLDHWAYAFIERFALSGITAGCGGGNYCPIAPVTRAQMAVFLERGMRGSTFVPPPAKGNVFTDVAAGAFAANFIEQLYLDGITAGCGANKYCPDGLIGRAEMAVFLLRAKHGASYRPPPATGLFSDVPLNHWAVHWIEQLAREGITGGCGGGKYCPSAVVTRDQMAVFLVRTFDL